MKLLKTIWNRILRRKSREELELEYLLNKGLILGENSHINSGCTIDSAWPWLISIGRNVIIASNVTILAHDASTNIVGCHTKIGKVTIGNNVFVGTGSIILCNTKIGDNVVIGAGSVVKGIVESNGVYVGSPAKKICSIEEYKEKNNKLLNESNDFSKEMAWYE